MPVASDTSTPAPQTAAAPRQEPSLHATSHSPLPASIAGAFAAAQYSLQHSLDQAPESEDAGLLPQLYASRIGPRSQAYYLAQFKRFDALDRSLPSWNMAAAFFTLAWCCLRGLWAEAAKYLAAITAVALIWWWGLRPALPAAMALGAGVALWLAALAVPGLLGNGWYWRKVRQQTLQAISDAPNMAQVHTRLQAQASPTHQKLAALLVLALPLAAAAGAGLALLPARQAEPTMISEPVAPAQPLTPAAKPASEPVSAPAAAQAVPATPDPAPAIAAASAVPPSEPVTPTATPANAEPSAAIQPASDLQPGKFYLNLGAFSNQAEAKQALSLLEKARLPVLSQTLSSNKGEVTRLRSGPFDSRKRAEKAARKLKTAGLEPGLFQADGGKSAP
ncbi:MAG: SPOR domain-containing protein [Comamonas sp.]|uniref:SPOR domain-containing protein n=1 Tax=Comamonas sp. TaxID=34028 RepID=UPI0028338E4F|nr:SPOR domain-containing protein [Comamonas sp.]MDR0215449.1 SPOR domain-containing protein [Comamonas sp.]